MPSVSGTAQVGATVGASAAGIRDADAVRPEAVGTQALRPRNPTNPDSTPYNDRLA